MRARSLHDGTTLPSARGGCRDGRPAASPAAVPGVEARAGKFPGPSLIPALNAIQARLRLAAARGAGGALPRRAPPAVRDRGPDLVLPALPHRAAREGGPARLPRPAVLPARRRRPAGRAARALRRRRRRRAGRGVLPRPLRHRAGGGRQRAARARRATPTRSSPPRIGEPARSAPRPANERAEPWPNDPYPAGSGVPSATPPCARCWPATSTRTRSCDAEGLRAARDGRRRVPDRAEVGAGRAARSPATSSTPSATPTSPSRAPSRTARSWPSSRTWCWRGCCSGMAVVGAEQGWVFIRHEYGPEEHVLRAELDALRAAGVIGPDACGSGRRLRRRGVHLARRLHPRRGDRAAGVHGGPPRRAAQQAAVPRQLRPARPADADELGGDLRRRAGHRASAARSGGRTRASATRWAEVLRRVRPRRAARRLLRADGHHRRAS